MCHVDYYKSAPGARRFLEFHCAALKKHLPSKIIDC